MDVGKQVKIIDKTTNYDGYLRFSTVRVRHGLFVGGLSPIISRELLERGRAAVVLPYDPVADAVILIEQFRVGALMALSEGGGEAWMIEAIAGEVDGDEGSAEVARREAVEEAGVTLGRMELIGTVMASPGCSTECYTMYCGEVDSAGTGGIHGLAHEGEDIRAFVEPWAVAAKRLADTDAIIAAPALLTLQWLALHRDRLREQWR